MKKSLRAAAAVLAAITAMSCAAFSAYADTDPDMVVEDYVSEDLPLAGGWAINESQNISLSSNARAKAAFKKVTRGLTGVKYEAVALLGTQVVAGTNYAILCRSTVVYPDAQPEIKIMYIYEDLRGNAEIMGFQTIIGEQLPGGFTANSGSLSLSKNKDVKKAYKTAMKGIIGVTYTPAAYLGSQVVAGTNYMILCRSRAVTPKASYKWSLVKVYKDLKGKSSLLDIETLELGRMDGEPAAEESDDVMVGIANPWSEYDTVAEAAEAAGIKFSAPDKLGDFTLTHIQAMNGLVDLRYLNGDIQICVRKGKGTDDISGDYNTYKSVTEKNIGKYDVTLKGNGKGVKCAVWNDGNNAYSIVSDKALTEKSIGNIIAKLG